VRRQEHPLASFLLVGSAHEAVEKALLNLPRVPYGRSLKPDALVGRSGPLQSGGIEDGAARGVGDILHEADNWFRHFAFEPADSEPQPPAGFTQANGLSEQDRLRLELVEVVGWRDRAMGVERNVGVVENPAVAERPIGQLDPYERPGRPMCCLPHGISVYGLGHRREGAGGERPLLQPGLPARVEPAHPRVAEVEGLRPGRVRIGGGATACTWLLPQILTDFHLARPGIELRLREVLTPEVQPAVLQGELDGLIELGSIAAV